MFTCHTSSTPLHFNFGIHCVACRPKKDVSPQYSVQLRLHWDNSRRQQKNKVSSPIDNWRQGHTCADFQDNGQWECYITCRLAAGPSFSLSAHPDSKEGCYFTFHRLSAKAFPRKTVSENIPAKLT
ncbi:hypothetical protein AVEN_192922-1 [Araneus ventricosus]|uniref:Uncharacterized protein n=1 Tax=Araneus ventricosus TaxID=182803 RepID=A0A4Y2PIP5_ARAVE|nr:hypothetical protein AVEN_192922-1 [Araneus ventricosus]